MNNFATIFLAIKKQCEEAESTGIPPTLDSIAVECNIPTQRLELYINCLHGVGFITYYASSGTIILTDVGKNKQQIFDV